jgi:hypothetical protein
VKRLSLVFILVACLLAVACTGANVKKLGELQTLYIELAKKFGDTVHVNGAERDGVILTITYLNSPLNERDPAQRGRRAQETAEFVKTQYSGIQKVRAIWVLFMRQQTRFVIFHSSRAIDGYVFDKDAHALSLEEYGPQPGSGSGLPPRPDKDITVGYASSSDATDVSSASALQLDGEPGGYGLTFMPLFSLPGNATRTVAPAPAEVSFLMASYSKKPRFMREVPIEFIVDGAPVMQAKTTFTGNDAQYSTVKVSYSVFRKLSTAKEASIKLGAKAYPLTPEHLAILRKMDSHVLQ